MQLKLVKVESMQSDNQSFNELLIKLAQVNDRFVFKRIYEHFSPRVKQYLIGLGCLPEIAEELMQEALMRVYQRAHQFDASKAQASTWIFRIARNLMIDNLRKDKITPKQEEYSESEIELEYEHQPMLDGKKIQKLMQSLPHNQTQVVHLTYFLGLSHSQIAQKLSMPIGTVKSNLRLAVKHLRSELEVEL